MPLSELYRSLNGKNESVSESESPQQKATNISYMPIDEFMELVWEKGQVMMQGQSSKAKKTPVTSHFQFHTSKDIQKQDLLDVELPRIEMGLNEDDDMVPWLNYPLEDYCSQLLPEVSNVTVNEPSRRSHTQNNVSLNHSVCLDASNASKVSSCSRSNTRTKPHNVIHKDSIQMPYSSSSLLNFSHFSRPAAVARANLQNNERKEMGFVSQPSLDSNKELEEPHSVEKTPKVVVDVNGPEKIVELIGADSSVCSGNSHERASNDLMKNLKRKSHDMEDFDCQSEDIEQESLGTKRETTSRGGMGSKRSRAAEVHNLSERRRRDRINEKMRALQELIPNCNKVDKASMLDEAIEYLKTLQLQVQMMSMGSGLCMPPMMFPSGMHPTHVSLFSPMGMGYGMGMGMGMADLNGGSRHPAPSPPTLPPYGHPMLFPQPPMPSFSTHPMQNKNSHIITPTSAQCEVANQSHDRSTFINKKDQVPQARCSKPGVD